MSDARSLVRGCLLVALAACGGCSDEVGGDEAGDGPALVAEPELIFHPNQPMIVDVVVELDRPAELMGAHDSDPGVHVASLAVEDEGRRHHLRVRGLAPDSAHDLTLTAAGDGASATIPVTFETDYWLPGFRPSFTVELGDAAAVDPAYRMFDYAYTPFWDPDGIYVIDPEGVTRWYYEGGSPVVVGPTAIWAGLELRDDGTILALRDGAITIIDELGEQRLRFAAADYGLAAFHHEVTELANGNFLVLSNSFEQVDYSSVDPELGTMLVAGDFLVEIDPSGEVVWTWDSFDHLDPLRMRSDPGAGLEYLDPETGEFGYDWTHGNGMVHTAADDQILLSMRHQDWIVAIDHPSGEVVWRLGEEGDFTLTEGTWFHHQHSPQWQPDGSLLVYDNGLDINLDVEQMRSRAVRYTLDYDAMTAAMVWDSSVGADPYLCAVAGDADRLPSGNVLVLDSSLQPDGAMFDIGQNYARLDEYPSTGEPTPVWSLETKLGSFVYRAIALEHLPGEGEG